MPLGSVSYSGVPGGIGGGQTNILAQIARRWLGQMQGPPTGGAAASPEADAAMARMLGLPGAPPPPVGQQAPQSAGLEGIGGAVQQQAQMPAPAAGVGLAARRAQVPVPMSKPAAMAARPPMPGLATMRSGGSMGLAALGRPPMPVGGV